MESAPEMIKEIIGMKTAFKVWNFIMIGYAVVLTGMLAIAAFGGSLIAGNGLPFFIALFPLMPVMFTFIMARAGLRGDYTTATKLGAVVLVLDIISLANNGSKSLLAVILAAVYVYMAISLNKYKY